MFHYARASYPEDVQDDANAQAGIDEAQAAFDKLQARLNAAKIAYLNGTMLDGREVDYEDLKRVAEEVIQANYALQRARFGAVRLKLSVAKLLRRGR
jgi:hypothetical protein